MTTVEAGLDFRISDELSAHEPPEARGLARDQVRLMVSHLSDDAIVHTRFSQFSDFLDRGDVLVVNSSATINAAIEAKRESVHGSEGEVMLHLSTPLSETRWVVELRRFSAKGTSPLLDAGAGETLTLPAGGVATLVAPYLPDANAFSSGAVRLWVADLALPVDAGFYTALYGNPIRYPYVPKSWPLEYYQTMFAVEPGSAEMPSAGRAFTRETIKRLVEKGVSIAPIILHTGVSSLETGEPPYPERYRVPHSTAVAVNSAHSRGKRVIAVGTTVVRALETVAGIDGAVRSDHGWTDLVVTPERGLFAVDAILTGLHEPGASHLSMLEALAPREHLALAYAEAVRHRYLWHEFGDLHLLAGESAQQ